MIPADDIPLDHFTTANRKAKRVRATLAIVAFHMLVSEAPRTAARNLPQLTRVKRLSVRQRAVVIDRDGVTVLRLAIALLSDDELDLELFNSHNADGDCSQRREARDKRSHLVCGSIPLRGGEGTRNLCIP